MRRLIAVGVWLLATVAATSIVWGTVSVVVGDVTDRPAPTVAHSDVVDALHSAATAPPTSVAAAGHSDHRLDPPPAITAARPPTGRALPLPGTPLPAAAPLTTSPFAAVPPVKVPPVANLANLAAAPAITTAAPAPPAVSATYATAGGVATLACHGNSIRLVSATPRDGYGANVVSSGPQFVAVHFDGATGSYPVAAVCLFGLPFEGSAARVNGFPAGP